MSFINQKITWALILPYMIAISSATEWIPLWPQEAAGGIIPAGPLVETINQAGDFTDTLIPAYEVYLPAPEKRSGAAVVIFPGGGYSVLAISHEGRDYAQWLNARGIAGIVVKYRVSAQDSAGCQFPAPLLDARRAIRTTRFHAEQWGLDSGKIGVLGSSAGGHLASMSATLYSERFSEESSDEIDKVSCRPDFQILVYPVIGMDQPWGQGGSKRRLLGEHPSPELVARVATYLHINGQTPPCFLVHSANDMIVPSRNSLEYAARCAEQKVPVVCHIFSEGGHGFGMNGGGDSNEWTSLLANWLHRKGLLFTAEKEPEDQSARPDPKAGDLQSFVGLTEAAAITAAERLELPHRIVERDGEKFRVTRDFKVNRLNFVIQNGIVTRVTSG